MLVAHVLGPVINLLNPQLVVIGGDVGTYAFISSEPRSFRASTISRCTRHSPTLRSVRQSSVRQRTLRGAFALALLRQKDDPDTLLTLRQRRARPR